MLIGSLNFQVQLFIIFNAPHQMTCLFVSICQVSLKKVFRFEEMWLLNVRCAEMVEASWSSYSHGHGDDAIIKKVEQYGKDLTWWNHNIFGNVRKELVKNRELLVIAKMEAQIHG